jgi:hypothetical protein
MVCNKSGENKLLGGADLVYKMGNQDWPEKLCNTNYQNFLFSLF